MTKTFPELMKEMKRTSLLLADAHDQAAIALKSLSEHPDALQFLDKEENERMEKKIPLYSTTGGKYGLNWAIAILKANAKDYRTQAEEVYGNPNITFEEYIALVDKFGAKR